MSWHASTHVIPGGLEGVRATLRMMVKSVRDFLRPSPLNFDGINALLLVRTTAQRAVQHCPEKDYWAEVSALHQFVRDQIRYVRDMLETETLQYPDKTLLLRSGDCDDKSMLFSAMAHCIGYPSRFCAIAVNDSTDFSHVSAQCLVDGYGWINAETIPIDDAGSKADLGWFPPDATQVMMAHVSH
jgi:transglutaminase-like putative cysteine protease